KESQMEFKDGVNEFIARSLKDKIPILIFSAGLGDIIEIFLEINVPAFRLQEHTPTESTHIVSNFMDYDSKSFHFTGFKDKLIHAFNKNEYEIYDTPYYNQIKQRPNVILLGDTLGDVGMIAGMKNLQNILKIGFLNNYNETKLKVYKSVYDLVICNDQTFTIPNQILDEIQK
ncbi:unnamed protein product, partial [Didymodactylos carnosus]